jgi:hypothetical protein
MLLGAQKDSRKPLVNFGYLSELWLRHYAISWKVAGSIPDEVSGFFN